MSQSQRQALGAREDWWGENSLDDLRDKGVSELTIDECERLITEDTTYNVPLATMSDQEVREYLRDMRRDDDRPQSCLSAYEIARWKAHQVLREVSDKLSKTAKHAPPDRGDAVLWAWLCDDTDLLRDHDPKAMHSERCEVELTEPELHVGKVYEDGQFGSFEYGQRRHRARYDPEHGYIGGVAFDELPMGKFLDVVEMMLENAQAEHHFRDERVDEWMDVAKRLKSKQDQSDQDVLTEVLRRVYLTID